MLASMTNIAERSVTAISSIIIADIDAVRAEAGAEDTR
jgi:hypothetical protein